MVKEKEGKGFFKGGGGWKKGKKKESEKEISCLKNPVSKT